MKHRYEKLILSVLPTLYMIALFLIPMIMMLVVSFGIPDGYRGIKAIITHNPLHLNLSLFGIKYILTHYFIWLLIAKSIIYALTVTFICILIGFPTALMIASVQSKKLQLILVIMVVIPLWSCFIIRMYAWMIILGSHSLFNTLLNMILQLLSLNNINLLYSSFTVVLCLVYIYLPFMVLALYTDLVKRDITLIEASHDLNGNKINTFIYITLPLSIKSILSGSIMVFLPSVGMFVIPEMVGNKCSFMVGNLIEQQFLQTNNWVLGSTVAILTMLIVTIIIFIIYQLTKSFGYIK